MLNERTRAWADSEEGKAVQRQVFGFMVDYITKKDDGKYASVMRELPEIKMKGQLPADHITYAVQRLIEHGLLIERQVSRGYDIRISKKGWERWTKCNAKRSA